MNEKVTACALHGCDVPIVRRAGGGRPRLYCSDAHRAEARRRRLNPAAAAGCTAGDGGSSHRRDDGLEGARSLLVQALARLDHVAAGAPQDDARVAAIRAEATGEVLRAQQAAADAARREEDVEARLRRERTEWQETLRSLLGERAEQTRLIEELTGALDGARAELEQELLRHHEDAARADSLLQAQRESHETEIEQLLSGLAETGERLAAALGTAEQAEARAQRAEALLADRTAEGVELEIRSARMEEQSRQAADRLAETKAELDRLRRELTDERRHHRAVEAELRRRMGRPSNAGTAAPRRRPSPPPPRRAAAPGRSSP
jgi:chromosome segregation ATPase